MANVHIPGYMQGSRDVPIPDRLDNVDESDAGIVAATVNELIAKVSEIDRHVTAIEAGLAR